jgi:hypothetical protein
MTVAVEPVAGRGREYPVLPEGNVPAYEVRSRTAFSSNDPANKRAVTLTPHDTLIRRP